ncbi:hypothetical protein [Streptomyces sp. NPDC053728]|uniref:hypothetical protein n=1 Tax=Streptomyces sp. NPDC053728 TaxID=3155534 RepID=UPI00342D54D9
MIACHVTWNGAEAEFFELTGLDPGARVAGRRADRSTAEFTVERTAVHPEDAFPTVEVHRNLDHAGRRLITCGDDRGGGQPLRRQRGRPREPDRQQYLTATAPGDARARAGVRCHGWSPHLTG